MSKYAVIATGGKQYRVSVGDTILVERLPKSEGKIIIDKVLLVDDGNTAQIGTPYLVGAKVTADLLSEKKTKKVSGVNYKAKSNRRTKYGHRQILTQIKITDIT